MKKNQALGLLALVGAFVFGLVSVAQAQQQIVIPSAFKSLRPAPVDIQGQVSGLRQLWCEILTAAEKEAACPGPNGPQYSEQYRSLCGETNPEACREALGLTREKCPGFIYTPGGC